MRKRKRFQTRSGFLKNLEPWKKEWQSMPEFIQEDLMPFKSIFVHFETKEDMDAFSKLIDQKITYKTKGVWYPKAEYEKILNKRYVDES